MFINVKGRLVDLSHPRIMGIINVTDDSFFKGSRYMDDAAIVTVAGKMIDEGADILDLGGSSTRPGAKEIPEDDEKRRVCHAVSLIREKYPDAILSVDTYRASVADEAIRNAGADMINDISGGEMDEAMIPLVISLNVPYVLMHMQGTPQTMQHNPHYKDVVADILYWFGQRVPRLKQAGVKDLIIDPGFGFGKSSAHNFELLRRLNEFLIAGLPLLVGVSRKSMIWRTLDITPEESLTGTAAIHMVALMKGASILRAHDVREAKEVITLFEKIWPGRTHFDHYS